MPDIGENGPVAYLRSRLRSVLSSPTRKRLASGAFWGGLATGGSKIIAVVASFFLARILGKVGFGEYGMINSTAAMFNSMAGLGIGLTVTKYVAELKHRDPERVGRILALSSAVTALSAVVYAVVIVLLAPWLAEETLSAPHLAPLLQISSISLALGVVNGVQTSTLAGCESFRVGSYISVSTGIVQSLLVVLFSWRWGLWGAICALVLGMIVSVFSTRVAVSHELKRHHLRYLWRGSLTEWRVLVHYSLPTFLTLLTIGPTYWLCSAFLANQANGYAELGIFNAASQWQGAIQIIPGLAGTALVPVISEKWGSGDREGSVVVVKKMIAINVILVVPIGLVLCSLSSWIMSGYGSSFSSGSLTMIIMTAVGALISIFLPTSQLAVASGQMWKAFYFNLAWAVVIIVASYFFVRLGSKGLGAARLVATSVHTALFLSLLRTRNR